MRTFKGFKLFTKDHWRIELDRDVAIKNAAWGFGLGSFYGMSQGSLFQVALMGLVGAALIGTFKSLWDYKATEVTQREDFEKQLNVWMHHVVLMLASGTHPLKAVEKSAEACNEHAQFKMLCESLLHSGDMYQCLSDLSEYAQALEVQRFNARITLFERQGNAALLELMEEDLSSFNQRLIGKAQMKIEKSILRQALPSLLIFATIMVHMMYPLLLGGIL